MNKTGFKPIFLNLVVLFGQAGCCKKFKLTMKKAHLPYGGSTIKKMWI